MINSAKDGVCRINKQDDGQISVPSGGMIRYPHKCDPFCIMQCLILCVNVPLLQHLFTCELNGKELRSVADCVERLKLLDGMGRVWGQNMLLEVRGTKLLLTDIETKVSSM